jgi:hypothetical protein
MQSKKNMKDSVNSTEDMSGNRSGVFKIARKIINIPIVSRAIPKQEATVLFGCLSFTCSENIEL